MIQRRELLLGPLAGFAVFALLREARATVASDSRIPARRWVLRQDELAHGLATGTLKPLE